MSAEAEEEESLDSPSPDRVLRRAFCLSAVVCRSFLEEDATDEDYLSMNGQFLPWLAEVGAEAELEPWEAAALALPLGGWEEGIRINGSWQSEGLVVLAWALGRFDLPPLDEEVSPQELTESLKLLEAEAAGLLEGVALRSDEEIQTGAERAFAIHWRLRNYSLKPEPMDFAQFARTSWFGPLNIEGVALVDSDLSLGGTPIARAEAEAVRAATSAAFERHRAFNWLVGGFGEVYSEVDTST